MEGEENHPDLDKLLAEPEFVDMADRMVITAESQFHAKFTHIRGFVNAANGQK